MNVSAALGAATKPVALDGPKVYHIPGWSGFLDPKRMDVISRIAKMRGRDPRIATLAVSILKDAGAEPREYEKQSAAILRFVQQKLYYVNEPGERLSDPLRTLRVGYGDCDDLVIVAAALLESIRMPWKLVISGTTKSGKKIRYHQGDKFPRNKGINWSHIYLAIGDRPFTPTRWRYAETTVRGAPLGWDVVDGSASQLPEMQSTYGATTMTPYGFSLKTATYNVVPGSARLSAVPQPGPTHTQVSPGLSTQTVVPPEAVSATTAIVADTVVTEPDAAIYEGTTIGGGFVPSMASGTTADGARGNMTAILVRDPSGRVLLLQRSSSVGWKPEAWDLPGGQIRPHRVARPQAAILLGSETGVSVDPSRLRRLVTLYQPSLGTSVFFTVHLSATEASACCKFNTPEHQAYRWVEPQEVFQMGVAPYVHIALRAARNVASLDPYARMAEVAAGVPVTDAAAAVAAAEETMASSVSATLPGETPGLVDTSAGASALSMLGHYGADEDEGAFREYMERTVFGIPYWAVGAGIAAYFYWRRR